ncbi:MAG: DUF1643 domain-containing protein [Azonexus sp.]|nr:DUF1643 domain-containing protein [Azonexus sp.]
MGYKIRKDECYSEGPYRYVLAVDTDSGSDKTLVLVQCNPSVANGKRSDPTVGKVSYWAEENGFKTVVFLNLFAYVSSDTANLEDKSHDLLVGPKNDETLAKYIVHGSTVVLAWGGSVPVSNEHYLQRVTEIKQRLDHAQVTPYRVGNLSYGRYPRHGRMWNKGNRQLLPLEWSAILL